MIVLYQINESCKQKKASIMRLFFDQIRSFAERAGFEPAVPLPVRQFSKLFLSATQAPLLFVFAVF
jgi:hypothetical protein